MGGVTIISSKGQITIPKEIRDYFALKQADKLVMTVIDKDTFIVKPIKKSFLDYFGSVKPKHKPENLAKVREFVMRKVAKDVAENRR